MTRCPFDCPQKLKLAGGLSSAAERRVSSVLTSLGVKYLGSAASAAASSPVDAFARGVMAGADVPEHFYVFDLGAVLERWRVWTSSLPRVQPFYAVKCNPDRAMLTLLAALGAHPARCRTPPPSPRTLRKDTLK